MSSFMRFPICATYCTLSCHLLEFDKLTLKEKCEAYAIRPQRNEVGEWGLTRYDLRKLHHTLYHEDRKNSGNQKDEGPWA